MKKRIYIAGPMRGIAEFNFPAFHAAAEKWRSKEWEVLSPAELEEMGGINRDAHRSHCIRDISALCMCHAIYMLRGWTNSRGARAEYAAAVWMELDIFEEADQ